MQTGGHNFFVPIKWTRQSWSVGRSVHGPMATEDSRTNQTKGEIGRMFGGDGLAHVIGTHALPTAQMDNSPDKGLLHIAVTVLPTS